MHSSLVAVQCASLNPPTLLLPNRHGDCVVQAMRSDISDIRAIYKYGAYGDPDKFGMWIYGRRPDGKTVACEHGVDTSGNYWVASCYTNSVNTSGTQSLKSWVTEFTKAEWQTIFVGTDEIQQIRHSNEILRKRRVEKYLESQRVDQLQDAKPDRAALSTEAGRSPRPTC